MCKLVIKEKGTNDILYQKQFNDVEKAESLRQIINKYVDLFKAEAFVEIKEKKGEKKNGNSNRNKNSEKLGEKEQSND